MRVVGVGVEAGEAAFAGVGDVGVEAAIGGADDVL